MKKITFILALLVATSMAFAQNRVVLVEHFTQASCPPCASYNPGFQSTLDANAENVASIRYQTSWPGFDPMYLHNPGDSDARVQYYGVQGVPNPVLEGNASIDPDLSGNLAGPLSEAISVPAPIEIEATAEFINIQGDTPADFPTLETAEVSVNVDLTALEAVSGNLVAHIVVTEKLIEYATPPGSNGETAFENVMRKMLPSSAGTSIDDMAAGDVVTLSEAWLVPDYVDYSELAVVIFVQDQSTKEVHQAQILDVAINDVPFAVNAGVGNITVSPATCETSTIPQVAIYNFGSENLTSGVIDYSINGVAGESVPWSGNLTTLSVDIVTLPLTNYVEGPSGVNIIEVSFSETNGGTDEEELSNVFATDFMRDITTTNENEVTVTILTDNYGSETTWTITSPSGSVIASGGPYTDGVNETLTATATLPENGCYNFDIADAYGDGICCSYGEGAYSITDASGNVLLEGGAFTDAETKPFNASLCEAPAATATATGANGTTANGAIDVTASGGSGAGYSYSIDNGATWQDSGSFTDLEAGTYTVLIQDGNECPAQAAATVESVCADADVSESIVNDTNGSNGSVTAFVNGPDSPYSFSWSTGVAESGSESTIDNLSAGTYSVIITDTWGCTVVADFVVGNSVGIDDVVGGIYLGQNYPNPANKTTVIATGGINEAMQLNVLDVTGKVVVSQAINSGATTIEVNTAALAQGTYFYQLSNQKTVIATKKMVIVH